MTTTYINLWRDETSEPDEPSWIVSRDDDKGSVTLAIYGDDDFHDALVKAKMIAKSEGIELIAEEEQEDADYQRFIDTTEDIHDRAVARDQEDYQRRVDRQHNEQTAAVETKYDEDEELECDHLFD